MRYLRTNTDTRITVGPFLDKTDGITPKTALTVTSEKLTFVVDTAGVPTLILDVAPTASGGANDMVHITGDDSGYYDLELAAANVNYLGPAFLSINDVATHLPVFHEFMILPANIYDSIVLGTDTLQTEIAAEVWAKTGAITSLATELLLERLYEMVNNKMIVTEATGGVALRNLADSADVATGNVQDLGATTVRAVLTWV